MNYIKNIRLKNIDSYNVIVEIPKGTNSKYELDPINFDKVEEVRKVKGKYPFYYGCFPQTHAPDNDPLDMILLTNKKRNILDVVSVQPIGIIKTIDAGEQDDKVLVIDSHEIISNLEKMKKKAMKFLKTYKGKKSQMILDEKIYGVQDALDIIDKCYSAYLSKVRTNNNSIKVSF